MKTKLSDLSPSPSLIKGLGRGLTLAGRFAIMGRFNSRAEAWTVISR